MNIRQLVLAASLAAALLTLILGGISAYTIRLLNENLSSSSVRLNESVTLELGSMEASNGIAQLASGILAASNLEALERQNPRAAIDQLKAQTDDSFDWSVGDSVMSLYEAKRNYLRTSGELNKRMGAFLREVSSVAASASNTADKLSASTLESTAQQQREISGRTNDATSSTLKDLDETARGTLDDVVLVLQLRGKLLEMEVAVDAYAGAPSSEKGTQIRKMLSDIGDMFTRIPENVAGPFEVVELEGLRSRISEQLTGKGGLLVTAGPVLPAAMKTLTGTLVELDGRLLELADNTVFDGTTSLASYLGEVSGTLSGSLATLIQAQEGASESIQGALTLGQVTASTKEALYDLVFLVQDAVVNLSPESVARLNKDGQALLGEIEDGRARLVELLVKLGAEEEAATLGKRLEALIAQARGNDGLIARTGQAVAAYESSRRSNEEIEESLASASKAISQSFRDLTSGLTTNMESKVSEGGVWMRVQLLLVVFIFAVAIGLGLWIGSMVARRLGSAVVQLFALSQRLSASSASLTESSDEQASASSEQAASLEESSSTVEEISSMAARNSESVREASRISADVLGATLESTDKMAAMSKGMNELHRASDQISKIIRAIDEIAFQTNILALNAAVEAARAGEAGAGFAVVADEVRALALKCKNAAQETEQIIARNTSLTREGVAMSSSVAESLNSIRDRINKLDTLIKSIADASQEQSVGLDQINRGLAETSATTQKNAALAQQGASSAAELNTEARNLIETIDNLTRLSGIKLNGDGHGQALLGAGHSHAGSLPPGVSMGAQNEQFSLHEQHEPEHHRFLEN